MKKFKITCILVLCFKLSIAQNNFEKYISIDSGSTPLSGIVRVNVNKDILIFDSYDWDYQMSFLFDSSGNVKWSHRYFFPMAPNSVPYYNFRDVAFTDDSGFIIAGSTSDSLYDPVLTLFRFDSTGVLKWARRYLFNRWDYGTAILPQPGGKFAVCATTLKWFPTGISRTAVHFLIIDSLGNILKSKRIYSEDLSFEPRMMKPMGSDFIIEGTCGFNSVYAQGHTFLMKLDSSGNVLITKIVNAYISYKARGLEVTHDHKVLYAFGDTPATSFYNLMKLDENLDIEWCNKISPPGLRLDLPFITESPDGNYLMSGLRWQTATAISVGCKIDTSGNVIAGYTTSYLNGGGGSQALPYGDKLLISSLQFDQVGLSGNVLLTTDYNFNASCATASLPFTAIPYTVTDSLVQVIYAGNYPPNSEDTITVLYLPLHFTVADVCSPVSIHETTVASEIKIFPNPASAVLTILSEKNDHIAIFNLYGEMLINANVPAHANGKTQLDISLLSPGIYFIKTGNKVKKFVKE